MIDNLNLDQETEEKIIQRFKRKSIDGLSMFDNKYMTMKIYSLLLAAKEIASSQTHGIEFLEEAFQEVLSK